MKQEDKTLLYKNKNEKYERAY